MNVTNSSDEAMSGVDGASPARRERSVRTEELTPWVALAGREVADAAGALLGVPAEGLEVRVREKAAPGFLGMVVVSVPFHDALDGHGSLDLELGEAAPGVRTWFSHHGLGVGYRRGRDGVDPHDRPHLERALREIRTRIGALGPKALAARVVRLIQALSRAERQREVADWMFRQVSRTVRGTAYGTLRLGFRCNQDCSFCWQARDWPEPEHEVFMGWLDEMAAAGIGELTISGGEPTLYRGLPELLERATRTHGMSVGLQTNAIRLRKDSFVQRLVAAGLESLFVSFHSADPEVSDRMTRAPGTWAGTVAGIEAALGAGLEVQLNCVVERVNHGSLAHHARTIVERFVDPFPLNPVKRVVYSNPCESYDVSLWAEAVAPLDEVAPALVEAARVLRAAGIPVNVVGSSCGFPPCVVRGAPELIEWAEPVGFDTMDVSGRFHPPACDGCAARDRCIGVRREYHALHGDRGLQPFASLPAEASGDGLRGTVLEGA